MKNHENLSTNTVCVSLWTHRRVLQMIFWDSRDIIQVAKKNLDEKYFFIMEIFVSENFEIWKLLNFQNLKKTQNIWKFQFFQILKKIKMFYFFSEIEFEYWNISSIAMK